MPSVLRCDQCASVDLRKVGDHEYVCNHCKARQVLRPGTSPARAVEPRRISTPRELGYLLLGLAALVGTAAALLAVVRPETGRRRDPERRLRFELPKSGRSSSDPGQDGAGTGRPSGTPLSRAEFTAVKATPKVSAELTEPTPIRDSIGNLYIFGLYKNTGEAPIFMPSVEAILWDKDHHKLAMGSGSGMRNLLPPGDATPVKILVSGAPRAYESITYHLSPSASSSVPPVYKLTTREVEMTRDSLGTYIINGLVKNADTEPLRFVNLTAVARDEAGKLVGADHTYAQQKVLRPGDESPFRLYLHLTRGKPHHYELTVEGSLATGE